jgi:3'-phosphoadenosine 5'-phosphosulfate (PAPS) 3'-phosphatase
MWFRKPSLSANPEIPSMSGSRQNYRETLDLAITAARCTRTLLRDELHRLGGPHGHGSHANGDDEAGRLSWERLRPLGWGLGCEDPNVQESDSEGHHIWLIDLNDGTWAYLKGWRGSTVSITGLRDVAPVLGVVPVRSPASSGEANAPRGSEGAGCSGRFQVRAF